MRIKSEHYEKSRNIVTKSHKNSHNRRKKYKNKVVQQEVIRE